MLISLSNVKKIYNGNYLLNDVTFTINELDKIALVGLNGSGKTTIFKIIKELETKDDGEIFIKKDTRISYLDQIPVYHKKVREVLNDAFKDQLEIKSQMEFLEKVIESDHSDINIKKYSNLETEFARRDGYLMETNLKMITNGLKINDAMLNQDFMTLSGGEKSRVILAKILLEKPDCLLLDEPSNHLDMECINFLENYLLNYEGAVLIISHDRYLLDKVAKKVINVEDGKTYEYKGNYSQYLVQKQLFVNQRLAEFEAQSKKIKNLEEQIARFKLYAKMGGGAKMDKKAKSRVNMLNKIEKLDKPKSASSIKINMNKTTRSSKELIKLIDYKKSFADRLLIDNTNMTFYSNDRAFIIGKNGTGKTTLFKSILNETDYHGEIFLAKTAKTAYFRQEFNYPDPNRSVLNELQYTLDCTETVARTALAKFLFFGEDVFKKVSNLSGGEKAKLELCKIVNQDFNLLLLDEPTNHLDIESKEMLELALSEYDGTILCISHDRYFIKKLASYILELEDKQLNKYEYDFDTVFDKDNKKTKVKKIVVQEKKTTKLSNNKINEYKKRYAKLEDLLELNKTTYDDELKKENIDFSLIEKLLNEKELLEEESFEILEILEEV